MPVVDSYLVYGYSPVVQELFSSDERHSSWGCVISGFPPASKLATYHHRHDTRSRGFYSSCLLMRLLMMERKFGTVSSLLMKQSASPIMSGTVPEYSTKGTCGLIDFKW